MMDNIPDKLPLNMYERHPMARNHLETPLEKSLREQRETFLKDNPIQLLSEEDAIQKTHEFFPTFGETLETIVMKGTTLKHLRTSQYKQTIEKECRKLWLYQSLRIYIDLYSSGDLIREVEAGLRFTGADGKAIKLLYHFILREQFGFTTIVDMDKLMMKIAETYGEEVEFFR